MVMLNYYLQFINQFRQQAIYYVKQIVKFSIVNILIFMELVDKVLNVIPPCPKTVRGQSSTLQSSPTHLLYFNGCTVVLKPYDNSSSLYINHNCLVTGAKFSYGHNLVASIDEKGTLLIHEVQKDKLVLFRSYQGFYAGGKVIDWTSDNKRICVVGSGKNKFGRIISVDTGTDLGEVCAVTANLTAASFRPEKPYKLALGGQQFTVKFYEGPPYKFVSSKKAHSNYINQIKYSPNGKLFVSVGSDRKIVLYDGLTCEVIKQLQNAHAGGIMGVAWLNNQIFVTGGSDKKLKKWNTTLELMADIDSSASPTQLALIDSFVVSLCYSPQKSAIYFMLLSGEIRQVDENLTKVVNYSDGYRNKPVKIVPIQSQKDSAIIFDSNGKLLKMSFSNNQVTRIMPNDLCYNKLIADGIVSPCGFAYYLTGDEHVHAIDLKTQTPTQKIKVQGAKFITQINNPNINGFVSFYFNSIKVYKQNQQKFQKVGQIKLGSEPTFVFSSAEDTKQSDLLWVGNQKGLVEVFRLNHNLGQIKLQKVTEFQSNNNKVTCIQTYNDIIFVGDSMGIIKVWKWFGQSNQAKKLSDAMGSHTSMITLILIHKDNIFTLAMDNKISIWKLQNFSRVTTFNDIHKHGIINGSIIGEKLVSCGGDLLIKVHDI